MLTVQYSTCTVLRVIVHFLPQEWLRVLRECTLPDLSKDKSEIQQIKSLSLVIKDLKLNRNQPQVCTVYVI